MALLVPLSLVALAGDARAQSLGGSETVIRIARATVMGGGFARASKPGARFQVFSAVGQTGVGQPFVSENFRVIDGVVSQTPSITTSKPVVFGVSEPCGDKDGGDQVTVFGFNFQAPGAGDADVFFDGTLASNAQIQTQTTLRATTPDGTNAVGNPKAAVEVKVANALGDFAASKAFLYLPALLQASTFAKAGECLRVRTVAEPNSFVLLALGSSMPTTFGLTIAPFEGSLEIVNNTTILTDVTFSPSGQEVFSFQLPEGLAGKSFELQGLTITDPATPAGSFTNLLPIDVLSN